MDTKEISHSEAGNELERAAKQQAKYARAQFILSAVMAVLCFAMFVAALVVVPQMRKMARDFDELSGQVLELSQRGGKLMDNMERSIYNIENITDDLASADIEQMVENVNELSVTSQEKITEAVEKLNKIDFEKLNDAIRNLSDVIEPLAKFFNVFK